MVDPTVLNALPWPLPAHRKLVAGLLARWSESGRRYHTVQHLAECLSAASELGAGPDELLALWLHDAVHTNTPGADEAASAALVGEVLSGAIEPERVREVARLVLLTASHRPRAGDRAGAIVCDADLWVLGTNPVRYAESVEQLRAEQGLPAAAWAEARRAQINARLAGPIFHTAAGRSREPHARANLQAERDALGG